MNKYILKSISASRELNISTFAKHFGIDKKFKWDEPLILKNNQLSEVLEIFDNKMVYIFHFGSFVFVNFENNEISKALTYFKSILSEKEKKTFVYDNDTKDEFIVEIDKEKTMDLKYNSIILQEYNDYYFEILALVLAKSTSLERIEKKMDILFDEIEVVMEKLEKGKFKVRDKKLAKFSSKILRIRYDSVSCIEILDKPDIAWKNKIIEDLFNDLSELFELKERFETVKSKSEILLDTIEIFANLSHTKNSEKLEWIVIILIAFEVVMGFIK